MKQRLLSCVAARFAAEKAHVKGAVAGVCYAVGFFALNYLINNVIFGARRAGVAAAIA